METYIDRIKQLKNEKKMTNDVLAERSGIPLGTLSKILAGMSDSPKLSNIIAIAGALDCSVDYIATGTPENNHNYTLSPSEMDLVESYRKLDSFGVSLIDAVLEQELLRVGAAEEGAEVKSSAKILLPGEKMKNRFAGGVAHSGKRLIRLYELPVSAGVGVYLDESKSEEIRIPDTDKTSAADYALRISGNSMEPKYHNGDILLVQSADGVEVGEPGIFLLDGCGFFKIFGGDRLISLNPDYAPILLKDFDDVQCRGLVVGRLKRREQ